MELQLGNIARGASDGDRARKAPKKGKSGAGKKRFEIAADETIDAGDDTSEPQQQDARPAPPPLGRAKKSVLQVDSSALSALSSLSLDPASSASNDGRGDARNGGHDFEQRIREQEEMARAVKEVERLRLEMLRREEGVRNEGGEVVVKRKGGRRARRVDDAGEGEGEQGREATETKKKKKKKRREKEGGEIEEKATKGEGDGQADEEGEKPVKVKRKKKRQVTFDEEPA